jgi:ankyrin repeat protein
LFIHRYPETILSAPPSGALPLHLACKRASESIVKFLVDCFPDAVQYRDRDGNFPLDHALDAAAPNDQVVELLVKQYPVLLSFLDDDGRLPLHRTLRRHRNRYDKIVDILVDYCPGALHFQDAQGQTPLLQACSDNNSLSQVYSLVRKWPEQVMTQASCILEEDTFNGEMLPSALASKSACLERVQYWVRLHPEVVLSPDSQGRLPVHYAVISPSEDALDIVQFLMDNSDSCVSVADHHGRLPLHYAAVCTSRHSNVTELLMEAYPEGLLHTDKDGRLPCHYADRARQYSVLDRMCELYPDVDVDLDLVPGEVRWDVIQIAGEDDY